MYIIAYLRDSYVVDFVPRFDYSIKAQNRNPKKVYAIDLGIFHQIENTFTEDVGRQLENAVYLHLRRKHKEIFYFNKNGECDFVVFNKGKALQCIQVCHNVNDMNLERELKGLKNAMEVFDTSISISGTIRPAKIIPTSSMIGITNMLVNTLEKRVQLPGHP